MAQLIKMHRPMQFGEFAGLASTPIKDKMGDIVLPSAFERSIKRWQKSVYSIPVYMEHDRTKQIGYLNDLQIRPDGLYVKGIVNDISIINSLYCKPQGLSVGMRVYKAINEYIIDADLEEISFAANPMNCAAQTYINTKF